ncbi:MAG: WYL domain-containing protein [Lachnospiraceae bacterium]|nr:WYL domain-containing protein [Lachnospiraceae bacterium]
MAKVINQKLKLLYIVKILEEKTDEAHPMSTSRLIEELAKYEIGAERKSIYDDIAQLIDFGYDIVTNKSKRDGGYYMAARQFELSELKLLVDSVQASRFITAKKSRDLITKLESFVSDYEKIQLKRDVYVNNRIKTDNESIYYVINDIYEAMLLNKKIAFKYMDWNIDKKMVARKNGKEYEVSPFALTIKDENYYLIAYDDQAGIIKHYRVDKIKDERVLDTKRTGNEKFENFDVATYANRSFGMYGGETQTVTLGFEHRFAGIIIDRFGTDIDIRKIDNEWANARVEVALSGQFYGWITSLGGNVVIESPVSVRDDYMTFLNRLR